MNKKSFVSSIILLLFLSGCKEENKNFIKEEPYQEILENKEDLYFYNKLITKKAYYSGYFYVIDKEKYFFGPLSEEIPYDFILGWKELSNPFIINKINFSQSNRWYYYTIDNEDFISLNTIKNNSSNHHFVPKNEYIKDIEKKIKKNDIIYVEGYLVDIYDNQNNFNINSSLSRNDEGSGSCEVVLIENLKIVTKNFK